MRDHAAGRLLAGAGLLALSSCGGSTPTAAAGPATPAPPSVEVVTDWADLGITDVRFVRLNGMCFAEVRSEYDANTSLVLAEMRSASDGYRVDACRGDR